MHRAAIPLALALIAAGASPAFAAVGLPRLADLRAGPYVVALHNDSPTLVLGRNTFTLELPAAAVAPDVRLALLGPNGETLAVPLFRVAVLGRAADAHRAEADSHAVDVRTHAAQAAGHAAPPTEAHRPAATHAPAAKEEHGKTDDGHAAAAGGHAEASSGEDDGTSVVQLRGAVDVPHTGSWRARLSVVEADGAEHLAETALEAIDGGPNRLYLTATGSLIAGSLVAGAVGRRRFHATPRTR